MRGVLAATKTPFSRQVMGVFEALNAKTRKSEVASFGKLPVERTEYSTSETWSGICAVAYIGQRASSALTMFPAI
jgi:hypothetical protein